MMLLNKQVRAGWILLEAFIDGLLCADTQLIFLGNITSELDRKCIAGFFCKCDKY